MKATILYSVLIGAILILAASAVFLARSLVTYSITDTEPAVSPGTNSSARKSPSPRQEVTLEAEAGQSISRPARQAGSEPEPQARVKRPAAGPAESLETAGNEVQPGTQAEPRGTVTYIKGEATSTGPAGKTRILALDSTVSSNDRIRTPGSAKLEVSFPDGTVLAVGPGTSVVLDEYVFKGNESDANRMSVRLAKGLCRFVTGLITKLNPDNFNAKARMTSIGIRGCEVALRSTGDREWIYVIGLEPGESVEIQADREERVINDMQTGRRPAGAGADIGTVEVSRERTVVSVAREKGIVENRVVSARELRNIIDSTSRRPHARFRVHQNSAETVFFVSPRTDNGRQADDE